MTEKALRGQRLKQLIMHYNIKQYALAQRIGVTAGFVSKMIRGNEDITGKILIRLSESFPILNMNWLMKGEGEMFLTEKSPEAQEPKVVYEPTAHPGDPLKALSDLLRYQQERIDNLEKRLSLLEGRSGGQE